MKYSVLPTGGIWSGGVFCVPVSVTENNLKFSNELQLKVLLLLLSDNGAAEAEELAKRLSKSIAEIEECLDYWVDEGILVKEGALPAPIQTVAEPKDEPPKKQLEALPMPNLTPKDIVNLCNTMPEMADLLRGAERILASSLSAAMKSNLVNMVTYYGLTVPVVLTLLEYYKAQRDAGKNMTTRTLQNLAKEWANEEITTLDAASAKLQEMESTEELWNEVIALCAFEYRKPTAAQTKMLVRWRSDFEKEMIFFACNTMKKYNEEDKQSLKVVDNILKEWKKKGFQTPDDVKNAPKQEQKKPKSKDGKLKRKPSFDLEEIKKRAIYNEDF